MKDLQLIVTLCPTFPHYPRFARDGRVGAVRLNSAMVFGGEVEKELNAAKAVPDACPLYFDIKGRQLRIREVDVKPDHLEVKLNHPIHVETPTPVLFKAGADHALLEKVRGDHLIFRGGPNFNVIAGESICIRHPSLEIDGPIYCDYEIEKINKVVKAGFRHFFLSYVESWKDVHDFTELIGKGGFDEIMLKIESKPGLEFVARKFKKINGISLVAARGDMYVELDKPHEIMHACKLIAQKDPEALVGSRLLLSIAKGPIQAKVGGAKIKEIQQKLDDIKSTAVDSDPKPAPSAWTILEDTELLLDAIKDVKYGDHSTPIPECHDFSDLAWLYDVGYRRMMICDELCLKEKLLARAVNAFDAFRQEYADDVEESDPVPNTKIGGWFNNMFK